MVLYSDFYSDEKWENAIQSLQDNEIFDYSDQDVWNEISFIDQLDWEYIEEVLSSIEIDGILVSFDDSLKSVVNNYKSWCIEYKEKFNNDLSEIIEFIGQDSNNCEIEVNENIVLSCHYGNNPFSSYSEIRLLSTEIYKNIDDILDIKQVYNEFDYMIENYINTGLQDMTDQEVFQLLDEEQLKLSDLFDYDLIECLYPLEECIKHKKINEEQAKKIFIPLGHLITKHFYN